MAVKWVKTIRHILITQPKSKDKHVQTESEDKLVQTESEDKLVQTESKDKHVVANYVCTQYSTVLPRMPRLHKNARKSWHGALIDQDMERLLELKWTEYKLQKLYPLKSAGTGNCLLEAVCLAIWGFHDISADLKDDLRTATNDDDYRTRWQNKRKKTNPRITQTELDDKWRRLLQRTKSSDGLWEDIHVFVLAQMLCRPIVVLSDDDNLAGIYLPLGKQPDSCVKTPIVLAYAGHFVPLVSTEPATDETNLPGVPLVSFGSTNPVIPFLTPQEESESILLLHHYMDVTTVPVEGAGWIPVAKLHPVKLDPEHDLIAKFCRDEEENENTPGESDEVEMCNSEPRRQPSMEQSDDSEEEEDTCSYPHCDKHAPEPWWPFCYEHSPDSGLAPGGLIYEYNKWVARDPERRRNVDINEMEVTLDDEIEEVEERDLCAEPECNARSEAGCDGLCRNCYDRLRSRRSSSSFEELTTEEEEEEEEEDTCSYPRCDKLAPEPWWPFCYEHSPDSGLAPGGLIHEYNKWVARDPERRRNVDINEMEVSLELEED